MPCTLKVILLPTSEDYDHYNNNAYNNDDNDNKFGTSDDDCLYSRSIGRVINAGGVIIDWLLYWG